MDKKTLMSLFIVMIMVLSTLGFILVDYGTGEETKQSYNGLKLIRVQDGWQAKVDNKRMVFYYLPTQVEDITIPKDAPQLLLNSPVLAITYDPNARGAQDLGQIQYYLEQVLNGPKKFVARGLTNNTKYTSLQQITCANATQTFPILFFNVNSTTNGTQITFKNNCITITAPRSDELYKATDRLLYFALGVMKE